MARDDGVTAEREHARGPGDLARLFVERVNAGDVVGLVELYEPDAILAVRDGTLLRGRAQIEQFYRRLLADRPRFEPGAQQPSLISGDVALTATKLAGGGATAELARRQADGTWLWVADQPNL